MILDLICLNTSLYN